MSLKKILNITGNTMIGAGVGCCGSLAFYFASNYLYDVGLFSEISKTEINGNFLTDITYYLSHGINEKLSYRLVRDSSLGGIVGFGLGIFNNKRD